MLRNSSACESRPGKVRLMVEQRVLPLVAVPPCALVPGMDHSRDQALRGGLVILSAIPSRIRSTSDFTNCSSLLA